MILETKQKKDLIAARPPVIRQCKHPQVLISRQVLFLTHLEERVSVLIVNNRKHTGLLSSPVNALTLTRTLLALYFFLHILFYLSRVFFLVQLLNFFFEFLYYYVPPPCVPMLKLHLLLIGCRSIATVLLIKL